MIRKLSGASVPSVRKASTVEATLYLHIGKRSIPRQIDLAFDEGLNQGIVVRVEHPIELDAMSTKM